jgi:hypothetical protein
MYEDNYAHRAGLRLVFIILQDLLQCIKRALGDVN